MLSERFGCRWKLGDIGSNNVVMSDRGQQLLGEDFFDWPRVFCHGKVHFMRSPKGEGLVSKDVYTNEQYVEEYSTYSDDDDDEEAYLRYRKSEEGQFAVCI